MPKQPCASRPRCGNLVTSGYCDACIAAGESKEKRPSAHRRGYTRQWDRESKAYLLENPIAVDIFGEHATPQPAEVTDHIVPHRGDMTLFWDKNNWQGLTKRDHDRKTAMENGGFGNTIRA